jgi:SMC interacting uncharacterized protein involved in chromosome segregation
VPEHDPIWKNVLLLALGSALSLWPIEVQMFAQRQQMLREQQVSAMKEFAQALNSDDELLHRLDMMEADADDLMRNLHSKQKVEQLLRDRDDFDRLFTQYAGKMKTESISMTAAFGADFPVLNFPDTVRLPVLNPDTDLKSTAKKLLKTVADERDGLLKYNEYYNSLLVKIAHLFAR